MNFDFQRSYLPGLGDVIILLTFSILRFLSFGLECCRDDDNAKDYGLLDLLVYNYYFPLFSGGPVMTFEKFYEQVRTFLKLTFKSTVKIRFIIIIILKLLA